MGGGEDESLRRLGVLLTIVFPGMDANGGVRIGNVAIAVPDIVHFLESLFVGGVFTGDFLAHIFDAVATEIEEPRKIIGIADIHCIRISGNGRAGIVVAGEQVSRDDVISVGGGNETSHRQADSFSDKAGGEIAEIAAGNGDDKRDGRHGQLAVGSDVIEHLRQQAANVDGVGGSEKGALCELLVGEGLLDETLAIVEGPGNLQRGNVLAEGGELFFLGFADALRRIKNDNANAGNAEKTVGDSAARVARSGDKNGKLTRFAANEVAHQASHEAGAEILEGESGAVEKLEYVERRGKRNELHREINGFCNDLPQNFFGDIGRGEGANHAKANFRERQAAKFFQFFGSVAGDFGGHVEATVGSEPAQDRASKRGEWSFAGSAAIAHGK